MGVWLSHREFSCEVEFRRSNGVSAVRAMLRSEQVEVVGQQPVRVDPKD